MQALGLVAYVSVFAFTVHAVIPWLNARFGGHPDNSALPMIIFLLTFVTSALICSTIAFGYPFSRFMQGAREAAIQTVLWMILWLVVIGLVMIAVIAGVSR